MYTVWLDVYHVLPPKLVTRFHRLNVFFHVVLTGIARLVFLPTFCRGGPKFLPLPNKLKLRKRYPSRKLTYPSLRKDCLSATIFQGLCPLHETNISLTKKGLSFSHHFSGVMSVKLQECTLPETNSKLAPENGWQHGRRDSYSGFLLGRFFCLFSGDGFGEVFREGKRVELLKRFKKNQLQS